MNISGEQLKQLIGESKFSQRQIAEKIGVTPGGFQSYFKAKSVKLEVLSKILQAAEVPFPDDLSNIVEEPFSQYGTKNLKNKIPLIPNFSAVAGNGSGEFSFKAEDVEDYYSIPGMEEADFMIRVKGDSMAGVYDNGTIIICKLIQDRNLIQEGRAYLVYASDLGAVVKYLKRSGEEVVLESANTQYSPIKVHQKSIKNIARILGSVRYEG